MNQTISEASEVLFSLDDGVAVIKLNRPDRMNAVNTRLRNRLISLLGECDANDDVRAVVLTGEGGRALSSGQDLDELAAIGWDGIVGWQAQQKSLLDAVRSLGKPCITAIEGICVGLGFHVALCSDWRVAPATSTWGQPEVKVGLASIVGPYLMSLHVGHTHNAQLSLMADLITGQRAFDIGLLTELCEEGRALETAMTRARRLAALPPTAVRLTKKRLCEVTQPGLDEAFVAGIRAQIECFSNGEPQRMIAAFIGKRTDASRR